MTEDFNSEFIFSSSRSSGAGGQNVNKVNTKVELRFEVLKSGLLSENKKTLLLLKLKNRINKEGFLVLTSQSERTQLRNKAKVISKFYSLILEALKTPKIRRKTKLSRAKKERRLKDKKNISERKSDRKKIRV